MAKKFDNNMKGVLFINEEKRDDKQDPDYRGSAEVNGTEFWLSGWRNESKEGKKYLSIKFQLKEDKGTSRNRPSRDEEF